jgi:hypothetical protein
MFHVQHYQNVAKTALECSRCKRERPLVLFLTPKKTYSTVCQACRTPEESRDEAFLREDCFWRNQRIVPLREKLDR